MQEQLISFETAKLAKEKGFLIETDYYFWLKDNKSYHRNIVASWANEDFPCIRQPSQSLLQKWLREKHDIHIVPSFDYLKNDFNCIFNSKYNGKWEQYIKYYSSKTYEEALETGLVEALDLINNG